MCAWVLSCGRMVLKSLSPFRFGQALDQVVVQFLVAVLNEAEKIDIDRGFAQLPELVHRVIIHERGVIPDVFM